MLLVLGCAVQPLPPRVEQTPLGVEVHADQPVDKVVLQDPTGLPVQVRRLPEPLTDVTLRQLWEDPGQWTVVVDSAGERFELPLSVDPPGPLLVEVEAPVGQERAVVEDGDRVDLALIDGRPAQVAVRATALRDGEARLSVGDLQQTRRLRAGERIVALATVDAPSPVEVALGEERLHVDIAPHAVAAAELRQELRLLAVDLPCEPSGRRDPARPAGRVTLPSRWWQDLLRRVGLGFRPRDGWTPWAWWGVRLANSADAPLNVVVRAAVYDEEGRPAPAFRPRMREGDDGSGVVRVLLRVPAGQEVTASLPLYVDQAGITEADARDRTWTRRIEVLPLGASEPLLVDEAPLYVSRGSTVASVGLLLALLSSLLGSVLLLSRGPRWLRQAATSELMTIALFGSLTFLTGAMGRLLTMGLATLLGPFASLLTGLVDDALRYTLLATLLTLLPRPGVASLAVLTGWLLSGLSLGTFSLTDVIFVGGRVFWLEAALWLSGVTRVRGWPDGSRMTRWLRLGLGFGAASLLSAATMLVLQVVLYRLFLAPWYVALVLAGPSFLYVLVGCGLALPFAEGLRRIQR